jgi:hypothetical protein
MKRFLLFAAVVAFWITAFAAAFTARAETTLCIPAPPAIICKNIGPPPSWRDEPRERDYFRPHSGGGKSGNSTRPLPREEGRKR